MKHLYRIFILVLIFCASANFAAAAGHTVSLNGTNCTCFGTCNGTIYTTVTGGVGPFTYAWSSGPTTQNIIGLCPGPYTVTVTDQSDMSTATASFTVTQPTQLTIGITNNPALCNNANGWAQAMVSGGTPAYTFSWAPSGGNMQTASNLSPGTYTCTVTDANGCTATQSVNIINIPGVTISSINVSPASICAGQTATLTPVVANGTGPYTYFWSPPNTSVFSPTVNPTNTTTYTFQVTDANGCTDFQITTVVVSQSVTASVSSTDPTCNQSNGSLSVNVSQAAPPYSILWSNSQTTPTINNLPAGVYSVTVTDANGCTATSTNGLSNIGGPTVTTSTNSTGCTNTSNGSAIANVSGGLPPFTYSWNTVPAQNNDTATGLGAGNYLVTVTDGAGCVSVVGAQVSAVAGNLFMFAQWSGVSNCNQASGSANSFVQGGTAPYSYLWSNATTSPQLINVMGGSYSLTVTDVNGCTSSGSVVVPNMCANYAEGRVYYDVNGDSIYNAGDFPLQGIMVGASPLSLYSVTDANGIFWRSIGSNGTYDFSLINQSPAFQNGAPVSGHRMVTFTVLGDTVSGIDFALSAPLPVQDLYVSLASGVARPGWSQLYSVHAENRGSTTVSDTMWFQHDSILTLIWATPAFDGYTFPRGYWLYNNFTPGSNMNNTVVMQVPTIPNGGFIGRNLFASAGIEPTSSDTTPTDNGDDEHDIITGSYDPNLKECWSPTMNASGDIWPTDLTLDYTIHFQNSGNDTAFFVIVVDTLPVELDITTFRMGASSHPCTYSISGFNDTNIVTFTFMNILLPDSNVNEPASHGFAQFTIDRYPNLPIGTQIMNEANNYFDFNPAVVTNMNVVTVSNPLMVNEPNGNNFRIYPNPAQNEVNIALGTEYAGVDAVVTLHDISGREITTAHSNGGALVNLNLDNCSAGVYFITVEYPGSGPGTQKLIISQQ